MAGTAFWQSDEGRRASWQLLDEWQAGRDGAALGVGTVDGRLDLRGYELADPATVPGLDTPELSAARDVPGSYRHVSRARLAGVDLSGARLNGWAFDACRLDDVRLDGARLESVYFDGSVLSNCGFDKSRWTMGSLGALDHGGAPTRYDGCSFTDARMSGTTATGVSMTSCDLRTKIMRAVEFRWARLQGCTVAGQLKDVAFDARRFDSTPPDAPVGELTRVDFGDAQFIDVAIRGTRIEHVRWPVVNRFLRLTGDLAELAAFAVRHREEWGPNALIQNVIDGLGSDLAPAQREAVFQTDFFHRAEEREFERQEERDVQQLVTMFGGGVELQLIGPETA